MVKQTGVHPYDAISAIKRKEPLIHITTWMDLKEIMLNGGGAQLKKDTYFIIPFILHM